MKKISLFSFFLLMAALSPAQDTARQRQVFIKGYIKDLQGVHFSDNADEVFTSNMLHNRVNLRWESSQKLTARLELRNRLFWGEQPRLDTMLADRLSADDGIVDLSFSAVDAKSLVLNLQIDRMLVEWSRKKWEITLGRQRINWGINTVWNPNDIFNAFNYFDFDYEERPGTDALRIRYDLKEMSSVEVVAQPEVNIDQAAVAALYRSNYKSYDMQFIAGFWKNDIVGGAGWAGDLHKWGFKGEGTWFHPSQSFADTTGTAALSITFDRMLKNDYYIMFSGLYTSSGSNSVGELGLLPALQLSAKRLMPFKYSLLMQASHAFSPIVNTSLAVVYSPAGNALIALPTMDWSISNNTQLALIGQLFWARSNGNYCTLGNSIYLRITWNYTNR